jgi:hypothetical protein
MEALRRLLAGLVAGVDVFELSIAVFELHPKNNTFPGEVFMLLGAETLELAGITRDEPLLYEGLRETYLAECEFRGRDNRKIQFAILCCAATRGGLKPDLLDDVIWWQTDDFWRYSLLAAVALIRATADRQGVSVPELAHRLADHLGIEMM